MVLPARAGVILINVDLDPAYAGFTRTRGGDPPAKEYALYKGEFYPHARG